MRGSPKDPVFKAKVVKLRKEGKKWPEVAKEMGVGLSAAKQYSGRIWFKKGMEDTKEPEEKIDEKEKEDLTIDKEKEKPSDVVDKTKKKAQKQVDEEIGKHITTSDKKPPGTLQKKEEDKTFTTDQTVKSEPKSKGGNVWFLLAIVLAVVVIAVVFLILRPKPEERAEYQKPTGGEKKSHGFEDRSIEDL